MSCVSPQAAAGSRTRVQKPQQPTHNETDGKSFAIADASGGTAAPLLQLVFPPSLTAGQRALLHEVAEREGLPHSSHGEGAERHLRLGDGEQQVTLLIGVCIASPSDTWCTKFSMFVTSAQIHVSVDDESATDEQLCAALLKHLQIDASDAFPAHVRDGRAAGGAAPRAISKAARGQVGHSWPFACAASGCRSELCMVRISACISAHAQSCLQGRGQHNGHAREQAPALSCEQFIAGMSPLLELERAAEVATAQVGSPSPA